MITQVFLRQPDDQTAIQVNMPPSKSASNSNCEPNPSCLQGEHVTLPCQVENKRGMLQWTRDGFGLGIERNLTGFDRYHMVGSDEEGKNTSLLQIAYRNS